MHRRLKSRKFFLKDCKKVITVGTCGKLVSSACYDKQEVCVYLQPFSR